MNNARLENSRGLILAKQAAMRVPRQSRLARTVADPVNGYPSASANTYWIVFVNASYDKSQGNRTPDILDRQNEASPRVLAHNTISNSFVPQGTLIEVRYYDGQWFFSYGSENLIAIELLDDLAPCGSAGACSLDLSTDPPAANYADEFIVEDFFGLSGLVGYRGWAKKVAAGDNSDSESGSESGSPDIYKLVNLGPPCAESSSGGSESEIESESASGSESESESESQSQSGSQSAPPESGEESSSKSTAIVPASWSPTGFTALFVEESPEVRFSDILVCRFQGTECTATMDPRFLAVCEEGTVRVCGSAASLPVAIGTEVQGGAVRVLLDRSVENIEVTLQLTGIRRGFGGLRFPDRTRAQFEANERFINSAYDK